ncbi:MAG: methyltransferase domain-containing protein [Proteobacteria bacterium]|nr:methyltransferase domain-containing protein [Pseudomonadota bacterium]
MADLHNNTFDDRYSGEEYAYGKSPNEFLVSAARHIPSGPVLCLADGEGRNSVWLATQGYDVTAVDLSSKGTEKTLRLAKENHVSVQAIHADLAEFDIGIERWAGIVSIFAHMPPDLRADVHRRCVAGLAPQGVFVLEAYTPDQLQYKTGGPPVAAQMMSLKLLETELAGLVVMHGQELVRTVREGKFHHGDGAVVQFIAQKEN